LINCVHCNYKAQTEFNIGVKWVKCPLCDFKTKEGRYIKRHLAYIHNIGEKWPYCPLCDFIANQRGYIKYHLAYIHNIGGKGQNCPHREYKAKYISIHNGTWDRALPFIRRFCIMHKNDETVFYPKYLSLWGKNSGIIHFINTHIQTIYVHKRKITVKEVSVDEENPEDKNLFFYRKTYGDLSQKNSMI